jgi:uncharacterized protein (TIGR00297 family)
MNSIVSAALAIVAALIIALFAYRRNTLSPSGALAATIVGALIVIGVGWWGGVILLTFFISSSALSLMSAKKRPKAIDRHARGHQRDAVQVLANGGIASVFAIAFGFNDSSFAFAAFAGALAAANADTWATEIGGMSGQAPRLILSGKSVAAGVSGGVTPAGLGASLAGGASIGLVAALGIAIGAIEHTSTPARIIVATTVAGFAGSVLDSVIGERWQAVFYCPVCNLETEDHVHRCGNQAKRLRGISVINNDAVNALATATGALVAGLLTI